MMQSCRYEEKNEMEDHYYSSSRGQEPTCSRNEVTDYHDSPNKDHPYSKKAATEVTALNLPLLALPYLAKPMARRSRMTVTRIWPG